MKIGTTLSFEVPDSCPENCAYKDDFLNFCQNALCCVCPVLCCKEPVTEKDKEHMPIVPAGQYNNDWAKEWEQFFKHGTEPHLLLHYEK